MGLNVGGLLSTVTGLLGGLLGGGAPAGLSISDVNTLMTNGVTAATNLDKAVTTDASTLAANMTNDITTAAQGTLSMAVNGAAALSKSFLSDSAKTITSLNTAVGGTLAGAYTADVAGPLAAGVGAGIGGMLSGVGTGVGNAMANMATSIPAATASIVGSLGASTLTATGLSAMLGNATVVGSSSAPTGLLGGLLG